ncbi:MAG: hypothetical protein RL266_1656, partial [Bacteroidota bacterium]
IVLVLGLIQFIPHERTTVSVDPSAAFKTTDVELKNILNKACMDCHSNETQYPWYANVVPVNYFLDNHIKEGREHLNFSEWNIAPVGDQRHMAEEIVEVVSEKEMPMLSYWLVHWDAKLTDAERQVIVDAFGGSASGNATQHDEEDHDHDH